MGDHSPVSYFDATRRGPAPGPAAQGDSAMKFLDEAKIFLKSGDGGFDNAHFKTSTNRAPRRFDPG